jgi:hypothetical protein
MASKTSVAGNRVTIDECVYEVQSPGGGRHRVVDEFGGLLGAFVVNGKAVEPDDYGVAGAHPILQIAKLWLASAGQPEAKAIIESAMVCRVTTHERPEPSEVAKAKAYFAWLKTQPGVRSVFFAHDPANGRTVSISVWENRDLMAAMKGRSPPADAAAPKAISVEVLSLVQDL